MDDGTRPERPERPESLAAWRPGGHQIIPRPPGWLLNPTTPWAVRADHRFDVDSVLAAVARRGVGGPPPWQTDNPGSSAVLVGLFDGPMGAEVLLTRRSWHLRTHRGEVSFPGGRLDPGETPIDAALREAEEEIALDRAHVEVVGELDKLSTMSSQSIIVPIVARLHDHTGVYPATAEVDRVLTVPLIELTRADTYREERWGMDGAARQLYFFELDDETVWGATARMLRQLLQIVLSDG